MKITESLVGFRVPQGVAVFGNELAVADTGNHRIAFFDVSVSPPSASGSVGIEGTEADIEGFLFPSALCFISQNTLVVADTWNCHLDIYSKVSGRWTFESSVSDFSQVAGIGKIVDIIPDGPTTVMILDVENKRVLCVDIAQGNVTEYFRNSNWKTPCAIAKTGGYFWVADAECHQIFRYDVNFNEIVIGGFGALEGQLRGPRGLAVDANAGIVYIAESQTPRISAFDFSARFQSAISLPPGLAHELHKITYDGTGHLFAADAAGNVIYIIEVNNVVRQPSLNRRSIDFGVVGLGYRLPIPVLVENPGPNNIVISSISMAGSQFHLDGTVPVPPISVQGGQSVELLVIYEPTTLGLSIGQMRIDLHHSDPRFLLCQFRGEATSVSAASIALVLDRSGSMAQSSGIMSKIERLRQAVGVFTAVASWSGADELSVICFSTQASVLLPRSDLTSQVAQTVSSTLANVIPGGTTSIGAGLQLALTQLAQSELSRKELIVLSDGMENTPPMIADVNLCQDNLRVFTVGLGLPEFLDAQKLRSLASQNRGYFQITGQDDVMLSKFFIQILCDLSGQQLILDPALTIRKGKGLNVPVYISESDFNITFVLTWEHSDSVFEMQLESPDGTTLRNKEFVRQIHGLRYQAFRVPLRGTRWNKPGKWNLRIRYVKGLVKSETAFLNVMANSETQIEWHVIPKHKKPSKRHGPSNTQAIYVQEMFPAPIRIPSVTLQLRVGDSASIMGELTSFSVKSIITSVKAVVVSPKISLSEMRQKLGNLDLDKIKIASEHGFSSSGEESNAIARIGKSGHSFEVEVSSFKLDGHYNVRVYIGGITRFKHKFRRERNIHLLVSS